MKVKLVKCLEMMVKLMVTSVVSWYISAGCIAGNDAAWVKCGCGQWIHDKCVYQSVTGEDGKERMALYNCIV